MANSYTSLTDLFTAIANSIRNKTGSSDTIVANDFPDAIDEISGGGALTDLQLNSYQIVNDASIDLICVFCNSADATYPYNNLSNRTSIASGKTVSIQTYKDTLFTIWVSTFNGSAGFMESQTSGVIPIRSLSVPDSTLSNIASVYRADYSEYGHILQIVDGY